MASIELIRGDITTLKVDAIVNAANSSLLGGGGVDGAIHRGAGPQLLEACKKLNGCPTGQAIPTPGFNLSAKWIIHTVGPVWKGGNNDEDNLLKKCYQNSLNVAEQLGAVSIAFPNISTGVYDFPKGRAAKIAVSTVYEFMKTEAKSLEIVQFTVFDAQNELIYNQILG